jgi:Zinc carboxypeptidase
LHGDERVGPTSVMEAANLLLEAASCEALPRWNKTAVDDPHSAQSQHSSTIHHTAWQSELEEAKKCRNTLRAKGIDDIHRQWLARLLATRRIVVVPTANALGYARNSRTELSRDPNRDFPYDVEDPKDCMRTIAGRTLNEIYRDHMFQLALTFHGGMEVVAYEWGAPSWVDHYSPDDEAQSQVAAAYSRFGGGWSTSKPYAYGTMNDMVYYVRGGMEDWAYAGSWDTTHVIPCEPEEFDGYPKEKTVYNNATLRVFNMLVETSDRKQPRANELGNSLDVLSRDTGGNGHVSRNIRLSLLAADLVEPYVSIVAINHLALSDDIVPSMNRGGRSCQKTKSVMVPQNSGHAVIEWTVGGAIHVDSTEVFFAKWNDIPEDQLDCLNQPKSMMGFLKGNMAGPMNGTAAFSRAGAHPSSEQATETRTSAGQVPTMGPIFRATIDIPDSWKKLEQIVVVVAARVDQTWAEQPSNVAPKLPPQSHVVNARTNPDWHYESAGKHIQGRLNWYSIPVTIIIGDYEDSVGTSMGNQPIETVERNRFGISRTSGGVRPKAAQQGQLGFPVLSWEFFAIVLSMGLVCCGGCYCGLKRQTGRSGHNKSNLKAKHRKEYSRIGERGGYSDTPDVAQSGDVELPSLS